MKDLTLKQMASELNEFYKDNFCDCQFSVIGRTILYVDYSIVANRKKYGNAPVYVQKQTSKDLRRKYKLMKGGLLH